ncbi:ribosomal protein S30-domain-containing protein [Boletus reticuloceps]|uniref:40S ribosomal protein S30 n=1 Tax=Boletus reticuloceps TaxID=495285 RepID=A0A8I2YWJ0_9AGAM|nr:ribosomal protein S30-domain-containing protein [Boletus reticuloceps]
MGKVHGSLARAGKVKSQTPKVEKQEKEKASTGRAKKRELYNRRQVLHPSLLHTDQSCTDSSMS